MSQQPCFSAGPKGISLKVRGKPGARADRVVGPRSGELLVEVRVPAEKGKANVEIARVLAKSLGLPSDQVTLRVGAASHHKVFLVPLECRALLEALCRELP
jgi:uncharacterized protein YggU (UPF0235/DUF167 family)